MSFCVLQKGAGRRTACNYRKHRWYVHSKRTKRTRCLSTRIASLLFWLFVMGIGLAFMMPYLQRRSMQRASSSSVRTSIAPQAQNKAPSQKKENFRQIFSQETKEAPGDLTQAAARVLKHYQSLNDSILVRYGYLDLQGNVWSCTFQTKEGVSIVFVSRYSKKTSRVSTVRLTKDAVRKAYQS